MGDRGRPFVMSFGDIVFVWECDHFDIWEHVVFDLDGCDAACLVGCDEEYAAAIPEVFAIFFAGFDVELHGLSRHCAILTLSVSMNMAEAGSKGMSAGNLLREEWAEGPGEISS